VSSAGPVVVATASNPAEAQVWVDMLLDEGIFATSVETGVHGALGGGGLMLPSVSVLVDRAKLAEARNVIAESGGAAALRPVPQEGSQGTPLRTLLLLAGLGAVLVAALAAAFGAAN